MSQFVDHNSEVPATLPKRQTLFPIPCAPHRGPTGPTKKCVSLIATTADLHLTLVKVKVTVRPIVSRPVRLGVRQPSGTSNQFSFHLEIFCSQLRVCYFVAPSLTRDRVCLLSAYGQYVHKVFI
jgi:hypothetical protein